MLERDCLPLAQPRQPTIREVEYMRALWAGDIECDRLPPFVQQIYGVHDQARCEDLLATAVRGTLTAFPTSQLPVHLRNGKQLREELQRTIQDAGTTPNQRESLLRDLIVIQHDKADGQVQVSSSAANAQCNDGRDTRFGSGKKSLNFLI